MLQDDVKAFLIADTDILAAPCSNRVYIDTWLPDKYEKTSGAAVALRPRGGAGIDNFIVESLTFEIRAFAPTIANAFLVADAVFKALDKTTNPTSGETFYARVATGTDLIRESPGGWYVVNQLFIISQVRC